MANQRCGNCRHLDRTSATDIGGLPIAICCHPKGVRIGTTDIHNSYVALDCRCACYVSRFKTPEPANEQAIEQASGGCHA